MDALAAAGPGMRSTGAGAASSNNSTATAAAPTIPLYRARRTMHTGAGLLTDRTRWRLEALFTVDEHVEIEATWGIYQAMVAPTANPTAPAAGT